MNEYLTLTGAALGAVACGMALLAEPAAAQQTPLNVRPGLWEITTTAQSAGQMPIPEDQLARLTPEQRSKLQAAMAAMQAQASHPFVFRQCLTEQQIRDGLNLAAHEEPSCRRTIVASSATVMELREVCTGAHPRTATARFEAPDPDMMRGTTNMVMGQGAQAMTVKAQIAGKRLSADCGTLAPGKVQTE